MNKRLHESYTSYIFELSIKRNDMKLSTLITAQHAALVMAAICLATLVLTFIF